MTDRKRRIRRKRRKKQIDRIKKRCISYALRGLVLFILGLMTVLMICGCLYIYEHIFKKTNVREAAAYFGTLAYLEGEDTGVHNKSQTEFLVVLDAGHGGSDGGTEEGAGVEKEINLAVVLKMKELLENQGISVILTRDRDVYVGLDERVETANREQADLFVSIHCNYYDKDSSIRGLECYYDSDSAGGKEYAEKIIQELTEQKAVVTRNAKPGNYHILRNARVPAVLVEMGYLSNYRERKDLMSEEYQEKLATELVNGIIKDV